MTHRGGRGGQEETPGVKSEQVMEPASRQLARRAATKRSYADLEGEEGDKGGESEPSSSDHDQVGRLIHNPQERVFK